MFACKHMCACVCAHTHTHTHTRYFKSIPCDIVPCSASISSPYTETGDYNFLSCLYWWLFCDLTDYSPTGSSVPGISQARILEWVVILLQDIFPSQGLNSHLLCWQADSLPQATREALVLYFSSVQSLICVQLFATPWTRVRQAFLSITNSRSLLKLMSIELVMPANHLNLCWWGWGLGLGLGFS